MYTNRVEKVLTLGKLLSLWFCFLLHSILFFISQPLIVHTKISSNELARPVMGTIFLVYITYMYIERGNLDQIHIFAAVFFV